MDDAAHPHDHYGWFPNSHMHKEPAEGEYYPTVGACETQSTRPHLKLPPVDVNRMFRRGGEVSDHALRLSNSLNPVPPGRLRPHGD
jgi:hypothetical protein